MPDQLVYGIKTEESEVKATCSWCYEEISREVPQCRCQLAKRVLANLDELKYVIHYLRTLSKTDGFTQSNGEMISSLCFEVVGAVLVWLLFCDFTYSCLQKGMLVGYTLRVSKYSELHGLATLLIKSLKKTLQYFLLALPFPIIQTQFSRTECSAEPTSVYVIGHCQQEIIKLMFAILLEQIFNLC